MKQWGIAALAAALALGIFASSAHAQASRAEREEYLRFCNKHTRKVQVAVAWLSGEKTNSGRQIVISKGWYGIEPGQCSTLIKGPLPYRYYYYYALDNNNAEWRGEYPVCISEKPCTIKTRNVATASSRVTFARSTRKAASSCRSISTSYFPIQNSRKIMSSMSSTSTRPVMRPSARAASRTSSANNSGRAF